MTVSIKEIYTKRLLKQEVGKELTSNLQNVVITLYWEDIKSLVREIISKKLIILTETINMLPFNSTIIALTLGTTK